MSDTVNLKMGSKPLDYSPGIKKLAPHQASVQPLHKPLLRRIFDRPDTYRTRPSYIRPILGPGPSHPIKPKPVSNHNSKFAPEFTATPKSKLHAHFANPRPTVRTQDTDAMGAATEMRMKIMVQHAKDEERRRSRVITGDQQQEAESLAPPPPSESHAPSPTVSPFVPDVTPRTTMRADTQRARVSTRPQSAGQDDVNAIKRPSQETERKRRDRRSIIAGREVPEYHHPITEVISQAPVAAPMTMPAAFSAVPAHHQQQHHQQYQPMNYLPTHPHPHPHPHHTTVAEHPSNTSDTRALHPLNSPRDPYTKSKSEHCFTNFFQAIGDIFLTLGHLCSTIASGLLTGLLGLVHVILAGLLLFAAVIADVIFTILTYIFIVISCHCCSGEYRPSTRFTNHAWTFGRESQWVWNIIDDFTNSVRSGIPQSARREVAVHEAAGGRTVPMDVEKGLPQGPLPSRSTSRSLQLRVWDL